VNLGRNIKAHDSELCNWVMNSTIFLDSQPSVSFNERVFCILNNIQQPQLTAFGEPAKFINLFRGYSLKIHLKNKITNKKIKIKKIAQSINRTPLDQFKQRNRKRNKHLYYDGLIENVDYIVCPISQERMSMIRSDYIKKVLGMEPNDYWLMHPNLQKTSPARQRNIQSGLKDIDPETGVTKHQKGIILAHATKSIPDQAGQTGYQKIGEKTKAAHLANVDAMGRNGYQRLVYYRLTTIMPDGKTVEQNAHEKRAIKISQQGYNKKKYGASKLSKRDMATLLTWLDENQIHYYFDLTEFAVRDIIFSRNYLYDLVIPDYNMVVEYQSKRYHACPYMSDHEWNQWRHPHSNATAEDITEYERIKSRTIFNKYQYYMWYVWEQTAQEDVTTILCYLKTQIMKF
jgi:hypothetical protein